MQKPIVAVTMGDPVGIGPEIVVKTLASESMRGCCRPVVIGEMGIMERAAQFLRAKVHFRQIPSLEFANFLWPEIDLVCPSDMRLTSIPVGVADSEMGKAAAGCLKTAAFLAMSRQVAGIVSAPLNKEAFHLAGFPYRDELAYLADITQSPAPAIVGVMKRVWTITVTEHIPFVDISGHIRKENIVEKIRTLHGMLIEHNLDRPRIAVAALNPHAGDGGLMGCEEIDVIRPAVEAAKTEGINAFGPIPADMVFVLALQGGFDGVVCMYHDQANIARKLQPKEESATLFIGLPFPAATTAHGTAFDKAGQGIADPGSLELALRCVIDLASGNRSALDPEELK